MLVIHLYNRFRTFKTPIKTEKQLTDKERELVETIRNFRKMYPQSIEFELYINNLVIELMYDDIEENENNQLL